MDKFSYVGTSDVNAIESLFLQYSQDPNSVDASWRDFFKGFESLSNGKSFTEFKA